MTSDDFSLSLTKFLPHSLSLPLPITPSYTLPPSPSPFQGIPPPFASPKPIVGMCRRWWAWWWRWGSRRAERERERKKINEKVILQLSSHQFSFIITPNDSQYWFTLFHNTDLKHCEHKTKVISIPSLPFSHQDSAEVSQGGDFSECHSADEEHQHNLPLAACGLRRKRKENNILKIEGINRMKGESERRVGKERERGGISKERMRENASPNTNLSPPWGPLYQTRAASQWTLSLGAVGRERKKVRERKRDMKFKFQKERSERCIWSNFLCPSLTKTHFHTHIHPQTIARYSLDASKPGLHIISTNRILECGGGEIWRDYDINKIKSWREGERECVRGGRI